MLDPFPGIETPPESLFPLLLLLLLLLEITLDGPDMTAGGVGGG